jgi:hypothetical protein
MTAFAHWTAMHAWWIARRTERDPIGKPWAARATAYRLPANTLDANGEEHPHAGCLIVDGVCIEPGEAPTTSNTVAPTPAEPRKRAPVQRSKRPLPDEGGPVTDADIETMKKAFKALPQPHRTWIAALIDDGKNGRLEWGALFTDPAARTVRRYELYRGVRTLAAYIFPDTTECEPCIVEGANQTVNAIAAAIVNEEINPGDNAGRVLASLDYLEAIKFSEVAHDLATNRYSLLADSTGVLRLAPVD